MQKRNPLIPIYRPESVAFFVDPATFPPQEVEVEGVKFQTNYLLFGEAFDLMGISMHPELIADGVQDMTDTIDSQVILSKLLVKVGKLGYIELDTKNLVYAEALVHPMQQNKRVIDFTMNKKFENMSFKDTEGKGVLITDPSAYMQLNVNGVIDLQTGGAMFVPRVKEFQGHDDFRPELIGFKLYAHSFNVNRLAV
jgi:hypothetical protein